MVMLVRKAAASAKRGGRRRDGRRLKAVSRPARWYRQDAYTTGLRTPAEHAKQTPKHLRKRHPGVTLAPPGLRGSLEGNVIKFSAALCYKGFASIVKATSHC